LSEKRIGTKEEKRTGTKEDKGSTMILCSYCAVDKKARLRIKEIKSVALSIVELCLASVS